MFQARRQANAGPTPFFENADELLFRAMERAV
jgi:hypothetical protein